MEELLKIVGELEIKEEKKKQAALLGRLKEHRMDNNRSNHVFWNKNYDFIRAYENDQLNYLRPWQINMERVNHGWIKDIQVKPMSEIVENLVQMYVKECKQRMSQMITTTLSKKITDLQEFGEKIKFTCQDIFIQAFGTNQIIQLPFNQPWWYEVPNISLEEEFQGKIYIQWCTIQSFDEGLQNAGRDYMLFQPKKVKDLCSANGRTYPLCIQFVYNHSGKIIMLWNHYPVVTLNKYLSNLACLYEFQEHGMDFIIKYPQFDYDRCPFYKFCKQSSYTSNELSVNLDQDIRHILTQCGYKIQWKKINQLKNGIPMNYYPQASFNTIIIIT